MVDATVDIGSETYVVYGDVAAADVYLEAATQAASWRALTDEEEKGRQLVTASRLLDRQRWKGTKTSATQALQWPRTGTGVEGVVDNEIPDDLVNASFELAVAILDGSEVQNNQTTAERTRMLKAGSVTIENFRGVDTATRFPLIVQELIAKYVDGASGGFASKATGVDGTSIFPLDLSLNQGM